MEVSVVIPNFNGIAFLDSVLGSLEGQTIKNFEVIFVDNGSSDGSCSFVAANYPWVHIIATSGEFWILSCSKRRNPRFQGTLCSPF